MSVTDNESMVDVFKALSEPWRLKILDMLPAGPEDSEAYSVSDLVEKLDLSQPCVSHHLKVLKQAGLVRCEKDCCSVYYYVNREALGRLGDWVRIRTKM